MVANVDNPGGVLANAVRSGGRRRGGGREPAHAVGCRRCRGGAASHTAAGASVDRFRATGFPPLRVRGVPAAARSVVHGRVARQEHRRAGWPVRPDDGRAARAGRLPPVVVAWVATLTPYFSHSKSREILHG